MGLQHQLHFLKAQSQPILAQYYAAADAVVMPSHYESFGMVVLEAMACGTPVIASNVGGLASTVVHEHTGLLVPVGDVTAFAQAMLRLLSSPDLQRTLRRAGLERAGAYAWPHIVERNMQLYQQLLSRQPLSRSAVVTSVQPVSSPG
jgi:D-inositol-3-phosphate glycosyltransferase